MPSQSCEAFPGRPLFEPLETRELLSGNPDPTLDNNASAPLAVAAAAADNYPWLTTDELAPMPDDLRAEAGLGGAGVSLTYSTLPNGMPILDSLPGAPAAIFLDFDGDTGTSTEAYDEDGNPSNFNAAEQANIVECWCQMSVYYAIFDITVTTIQPDTAAVPTAWECVGNNISGGWSYVGVFPNTHPESFNQSGDARTRVSGIAHEIGHNFGLSHTSTYDLLGNMTAEYAGAADQLHGPLMGVDYAGVIHKFTWLHSKSSPSTLQDDVAKIASEIKSHAKGGYTGDGFRTDDYGGTLVTAAPLTVDGDIQSITGIIERPTDADAFSFTVTGGGYLVSAQRDSPSGVDLRLSIYDSAGALVAAEDGDPVAQPITMVNDQQISLSLAGGTYYAIVQSHGNYADIGQYNVNVTPLPTGWAAQDVGLLNTPGMTSYDAGTSTFTVTASGADIWYASDSIQYAYETLEGDGSIIAHVASMTGPDSWAKTGLMIRESLAANSKEVGMLTSWKGGLQMTWRSTTGGSTSGYSPTPATFAPVWLKLTRSGNTFTGYKSSDGTTWTQWYTTTVTMNSTVYIGLAVTARNQSKVNTSTFDNVSLTGTLNPQPTLNGLPAPSGLSVVGATAATISLSWNNQAGQTGYTVERSSDGATYAQVGATATDVTTFTDTGLSGWQQYFYRVRAADASGVSPASAAVVGMTRPAAVTNLAVTSWTTTQLILNWTDSSGETGYRIERSPDGTSGWTSRGTVAKNVSSWTDSGLTADTKYYYRVVTLDAGGDAATSAVVFGNTRLPTVTGLAFTSKAPRQMVFQWNDSANETGYRVERSTNGTTWFTLTTLEADVTTCTDNAVSPLGEYYYRVIAVNATSESVAPTPIFAAAPAETVLGDSWQSQDIGVVGGSGAAGFASGAFTVLGSGADVWGTADGFRFVYQTCVNDGTIVARVASQENTNGGAKAGVMIRESLAANSKHAFAMLTPSYGAQFQYRSSTGGSSGSFNGPALTAPGWVRLTRTGNTFLAESSPDGTTWTTIGSVTISMDANVYVGLAVTSHNNSQLCTSTFDGVQNTFTVTGAPPQVRFVRINDGLDERSTIAKISVCFDADVNASLSPDDFVMTHADTGTAVDLTGVSPSWDAATNTATWNLAGLPSNRITDGFYQVRLVAAGIFDSAGRQFDGNGDGIAGGDMEFGFFRLAGDAKGDGTVDAADLDLVKQNLLKAPGQFDPNADVNGDGAVNALDLLAVRRNWLVTLSPPAPLYSAQTVSDAAAALYYRPARMYEVIMNNFRYEPYLGQTKGATATLQTRAGNDWDQSALLAGFLAEASVYDGPIIPQRVGTITPVTICCDYADGGSLQPQLRLDGLVVAQNPTTVASGSTLVLTTEEFNGDSIMDRHNNGGMRFATKVVSRQYKRAYKTISSAVRVLEPKCLR